MSRHNARHQRRRQPTTKTKRARDRANQGYATAKRALDSGVSLRVSNRTDFDAGTVHHGLARWLARQLEYTITEDDDGKWLRISDYARGKRLGKATIELRAAGENPDVRYDLADEARYNHAGFADFKRGLEDAFKEAQ